MHREYWDIFASEHVQYQYVEDIAYIKSSLNGKDILLLAMYWVWIQLFYFILFWNKSIEYEYSYNNKLSNYGIYFKNLKVCLRVKLTLLLC